jgi:hypothetical protein
VLLHVQLQPFLAAGSGLLQLLLMVWELVELACLLALPYCC